MPDLRLLPSDPATDTATTVLESGAVAFSIDEVARILRINRKTVVAMIERAELPEIRYARRRWVPASALRELLAGRYGAGAASSSSDPMISAASRSRSGSQWA
jgi:excisionase family DNA binding protein